MLRRIGSLLAPFRWWLALVPVTVVVSASLSAVAPFLTRAVFDDDMFPVGADDQLGSPDLGLLFWLVAGLIAVPLVSALIGVRQTYLTNRWQLKTGDIQRGCPTTSLACATCPPRRPVRFSATWSR